ncbi:hypothetical protein KIN20_015497 [Parelaphostrongylus tenuis]|uniref:SAP domain-containing protein n=1 Tax=Parelaphostrongylus tenuis TaxID=148309 RepID=A0AAD5MJM9_PARTN|nr:hypothetical protein KIN20_015497 [Parelaphostrongylus tenuis]
MESEIKPPTGKPASELPVKDLKKQLRRPKLPTSGKKNEVTARHTKDQIEAKSTLDDERTLTACKELTQLSEVRGRSSIGCLRSPSTIIL